MKTFLIFLVFSCSMLNLQAEQDMTKDELIRVLRKQVYDLQTDMKSLENELLTVYLNLYDASKALKDCQRQMSKKLILIEENKAHELHG